MGLKIGRSHNEEHIDLRALKKGCREEHQKTTTKKAKGELKKKLHNGKIYNLFPADYSTVFLKSKRMNKDEKGVQNFSQKTSRNETRRRPWAWNGGLCYHK
jgi:hypothetical protein